MNAIPLTVGETLRAARSIIDTPERWTKQAFARDAYGNRVPWDQKTVVRWCMGGAIRSTHSPYWCAAEMALANAIHPAGTVYDPTGVVISFNDRKRTKHADVLAVLDQAIAAAEKAS